MDAKGGNRRAVALVLAVFILGVALGAVGMYVAGGRVWSARTDTRSASERRARFVERLTSELQLSADQQKQIEAILADTQAKYKASRDQMVAQTEQVRQQGREQIRAVLTPEQRPKFEEFLRRIDEERKKKDGHRGESR